MKTIFSGIQPSGNLHLGNYLGAIKNWIELQKDYASIFCIVDLHAITVPQDPKILKEKIYETAGLYLSAGIDHEKSIIFIQSQVPAHSELAWIFNCLLKMGELERMTQFKDKAKKQKQRTTVGLFDYPALMSADILLYDTDLVPVGEDQKQHIELARDLAERFNKKFGATFILPKPLIKKDGARIMALDNPENKMSKSAESDFSRINLLDSPALIQQKIIRAVTDSEKKIKFDSKRQGLLNLLTIYKILTQKKEEEIESEFKNKGYQEFKKALAQIIIQELAPLQEKFKEIMQNKEYLDKILQNGAEKAKKIAREKLEVVKEKIGLG